MAATPSPLPSVDTALCDAFARHGPLLLHDRSLLERELAFRCPASSPDVALLLAALDEQVPQALLSVQGDEDAPRMAGRLEKRLRDRRGLNGYAAAWAVGARARAVEAMPDGAAMPDPGVRPSHDRQQGPIAAPTIAVAARAAAAGASKVAVGGAKPPATTRRRWIVVSAATLAVVVASSLAYLAVERATDDRTPPTGRSAGDARDVDPPRSDAATAPAAPAAPASSTTPAPPRPATPPPRIVGVATGLPLLGDGEPHDVFVAFGAGHPDVVRFESRLVEDDATSETQPRTIDMPTVTNATSAAVDRGTASAGRISLRTTRPARIVLEYVAITRDGVRSAPFVKTFDFVPVPDCPTNACGAVAGSRIVASTSAADVYAAQVARALAIPVMTSQSRSRSDYEVTVRMDDRSTRVVHRSTPLPRGTRVRLVDDRLVAASSNVSPAPARDP